MVQTESRINAMVFFMVFCVDTVFPVSIYTLAKKELDGKEK
jgi:hypothetical protein